MQLRHTKIIASSNNNDVIVTQYWNNSFSVSYYQALRSHIWILRCETLQMWKCDQSL